MRNIKFKYLYRDGGNYKNYGFSIFRNPDNLSVEEIERKLETIFLNELYFIAAQIGLPELFHEDYPAIDDVSFHEYCSVESTEEDESEFSKWTIKEFVEKVEKESAIGWELFDPREKLSPFG